MQTPTGDGGEALAGEEYGGEDADSRPVAEDGGEENEQPLFREEGDESNFRDLQPSRDFQSDLGFFEKKCALEDDMSAFKKPASDGVFPANKGGNDLMEMRGSLLNQKDGNLAKDKSSFRAPPFLGFLLQP
ncbi:UNVERIFIED_CONTAM: hypothetical protein Sindi_3032000 [Sesamum indicum]